MLAYRVPNRLNSDFWSRSIAQDFSLHLLNRNVRIANLLTQPFGVFGRRLDDEDAIAARLMIFSRGLPPRLRLEWIFRWILGEQAPGDRAVLGKVRVPAAEVARAIEQQPFS